MEVDQHRRLVANYFSGKVKELRYHLSKIVDACDQSLRLFHAGAQLPPDNGSTVTYGFSSFTNVVLTLKDSASTFLQIDMPWSKLKGLTHGDFIFSCRNAMTHDGHPIISMWVDGRYYVPTDIVRLDHNKKRVKINAPSIDIRTVCLEFTLDYCDYFDSILHLALNDPTLQGAPLRPDQMLEVANNSMVPDSVRKMFTEDIDEIYGAYQACQQDPIQSATQQVSELKEYCRRASLNNHRLKPVGWNYGLKVRIRVG